jgi:hypothetical protein
MTKWQDISTAPRDGTPVITNKTFEGVHEYMQLVKWDDNGEKLSLWCWSATEIHEADPEPSQPLVWLDFPPPPKAIE